MVCVDIEALGQARFARSVERSQVKPARAVAVTSRASMPLAVGRAM